ncbi:hypothetical protein [Spirosoma endbachense]|uniref:Beta-xylosidase C-terminal Concanavalin A-like domain-containing protein n=1 Tax=Spirosoma endbachense TaxID=2666025 RepID=A0A6P1VPY6_9BACT|nr:hypothetical protein [Spirosoma endbachense]QHV93669.1 hypothetical protein GJR95_00850 [Spirosoma endbachense]
MDEFDRRAFAALFRAVVEMCFGQPLQNQLSESESRHLSNEIEERTGLVVGWRSIKNYAAFLVNPSPDKQENPSVATLDTLARFVFRAPVTTEAERKKNEEHFPYWFRYREQLFQPNRAEQIDPKPNRHRLPGWLIIPLILGVIGLFWFVQEPEPERIIDDFRKTDEMSLNRNGWIVHARNKAFWNRRAEKPGHLTLFTLKGDNWHKTGEAPQIQNLLLQPIHNDCFRTEVHFKDFVPSANWQQAGLVLLEDTSFAGKSIRISLSYNDFFGGYIKPGEILIQAIASYGKGYTNLEEIAHQPLFTLGNTSDRRLAVNNLKNFAFRIEKQGQKFRFLYSASPVDNFSFKEVTTYEFGITPKYVGIFALKGFVDSTAVMPVTVRFFRLDGERCK